MSQASPRSKFARSSFRLCLKLIFGGLQFVLFFGLAWILAGCGNQANRVTVATATVIATTPLPAEPTATPTRAPTTEPMAVPTVTVPATVTSPATPTPMPTPEIDAEAQNFYYKGVTYAAAGLTEEAITSFGQAIAVQADYALAYLERGKLYMQQGQLGQAKSDFQYALEFIMDPTIKAEIESLLQQLATVAVVTSTPLVDKVTPTPQVTVIIASAPSIEARLEQPVSLPLGHMAHFDEANLTLVFQSVLEDSRCPRQVECFWAGQVRIMIEVQQEGTTAASLELNNNPPLKQDTVSYAGYDIHLSQVGPYPESPDQPIPPEAYRATFVIKAK
ncbi:MAG: tetratricopeptide repeat protein [Anaerolineales bacterium]|nr:tetratricopeptide repeat protein [Anaerolineales bacterium]